MHLPVNKTSVPSSFHGFVESDGIVSIEPEHATRNTSTESASYAVIPGYGRTLSGVTLRPVLADTQTPPSSPRLEYVMYIFSSVPTANVTVYLGPSLNKGPSRPLKYAVSFDDEEPQVVQSVPPTRLGTLPPNWGNTVSNGVWTNTTSHPVEGGYAKTVGYRTWSGVPEDRGRPRRGAG